MFNLGGGRVVNLWSNGDLSGTGAGHIYGAAVATKDMALDYVGGVSAIPEPSTVALLGSGLLLIWRRRTPSQRHNLRRTSAAGLSGLHHPH